MYIVDIDDFHQTNTGWQYLEQIKKAIPGFKANLFTVVGRCTHEFIKEMQQVGWIDMIPHGWLHETPRECANWNYGDCMEYLRKCAALDLTKGFKAPGWQIPDVMYHAAHEMGYWIADQPYNHHRRPSFNRVYLLDNPMKLHFHIQNVCGNGLQESMDKLLALPKDADFSFIKDSFNAQRL